MTFKYINREYESYNVHVSDTFKNRFKKLYEEFKEQETAFRDDPLYTGRIKPEGFADKWADKIEAHLQSMEKPDMGRIGKIDSKDYSGKYAVNHVEGTETSIFFLVEQDHIFVGIIGKSDDNWPKVLRKLEPEVTQSIAEIKAKLAQKETEKSGSKGKLILPPSERSPEERDKLAEKKAVTASQKPENPKDHDK